MAFGDLSRAWRQRPLWGHLGLQDIKQGYRRSVLGPLWITISTGVLALALGILFSGLWGMELSEYLPYVTVGLICWNFLSACINEGATVFIANEGLIKQLPAPITTHVFRLVWKQVLLFGHNMIIYLVLIVVYWRPLGWTWLLWVPAFAALIVTGTWVSILIGILATRFRDIPPIINSMVLLIFYMTPIVWKTSTLAQNPSAAGRAHLAELNPLMHYIEIIRQPLIGEVDWNYYGRHWAVVGVITVIGWSLALVFLRNYRARVSYWV
jgi:ABC-2 type transport system permease protein